MLILISNDDGVHSKGIKALTKALMPLGEVIVVAPDREQSGASHSLTFQRPLRIHKWSSKVYSVDGTPADCVTLALRKILPQKPDLVVSGINHGANLAEDIHYSGTVSAAMEGALCGIPAIAVSLVAKKKFHFEVAGKMAFRLAQKVLKQGIPLGCLLNMNVPNLPESEIQGYCYTSAGKRNYGSDLIEKQDPRGNPYYWIGGDETAFQNILGSDCNAILDKKVSITPLQIEVTHHAFLEKLKTWKI